MGRGTIRDIDVSTYSMVEIEIPFTSDPLRFLRVFDRWDPGTLLVLVTLSIVRTRRSGLYLSSPSGRFFSPTDRTGFRPILNRRDPYALFRYLFPFHSLAYHIRSQRPVRDLTPDVSLRSFLRTSVYRWYMYRVS